MIKLYEYDLPFKEPLITGSDRFTSRAGFILRYTDQRSDIVSEIAPLPRYSSEKQSDIINRIREIHFELHQFLKSDFDLDTLNHFIRSITTYPSLQYGLSWLGATLTYSRSQKVLNPFRNKTPNSIVHVNDLIGSMEPDRLRHRLKKSIKSGFQTIKIKLPQPDPDIASVIRSVLKEFPDLKIRLDANQSWKQDSADLFNKYYEGLPVEYIEEPFQTSKNSPFTHFNAPVARDESILDLNALSSTLQTDDNLYVVVKPMLFGSLFDLAETISSNRSKNRMVVISNLLESAAGRTFNLRFASYFGDSELAHGLNTGGLFQYDLMPIVPILNGSYTMTNEIFQPIEYNQLNRNLLSEIELPNVE